MNDFQQPQAQQEIEQQIADALDAATRRPITAAELNLLCWATGTRQQGAIHGNPQG